MVTIQFMLLGDSSTYVWTTCPRLSPKSGPAGVETTTLELQDECSNHYITRANWTWYTTNKTYKQNSVSSQKATYYTAEHTDMVDDISEVEWISQHRKERTALYVHRHKTRLPSTDMDSMDLGPHNRHSIIVPAQQGTENSL